MQRLPIKLLEPDMIVAHNVLTDKKTVLVAEGATLTEKLIFRLENMKVKSVVVQGSPVQLANYLPKTLDEKLETMDLAFSRSGDNLTMKKFRVLLKSHFIQKDQEARAREQKPSAQDETPTPPESEIDSESAHE